MAIVSYGYEGTMSEAAWAILAQTVGTDYGVDGYGGWKVELGGSGDRAITVQTGTRSGGGAAFGWGVADVLTANANLNASSVSSGTRWDTVVIRRNWQPSGGGTTTLAIVPGGSSQNIAAGLNNQPGIICDQPIALIRVTTSAAVQEVTNLRQSAEKVETYVGIAALPASAPLGKFAIILGGGGHDIWHRRRDGNNNPQWFCLTNPDWAALSLASGFAAAGLNGVQTPRYRRRLGRVELRGSVQRGTAGTASFGTATNGSRLATLPAGFRPDRTAIFTTAASYDAAGISARIEVNQDGEIIVFTPSSETHTWVSLEGVAFDAILADGSIGGLST